MLKKRLFNNFVHKKNRNYFVCDKKCVFLQKIKNIQ